MKFQFGIILVSIFSLFSLGCDKGDSASLEPLDDDQKQIVMNISDDVQQGMSSMAASGSDDFEKVQLKPLSGKIEEADLNQCITTEDPANNDLYIATTVGGVNCPINLSFEATRSSASSTSMSFVVDYDVVDDTVAAETDIDAFEFTGSVSASQSGSGATVNANYDGVLHSDTYGDILASLSMTLTLSQVGEEVSVQTRIVFTLRLPDFTARMEARILDPNDSSQNTYLINGEAVSEEEFENFSPLS